MERMKGKTEDRCETVIQAHLLNFSYAVDTHTLTQQYTLHSSVCAGSVYSLSLTYVIDHVCICELSVISLVIEPEYLVCG